MSRLSVRPPPGSTIRRIRPETFGFTLVLGLLGALPPLAIDISAPTLMVVRSQMATSTQLVGMVITLFMFGFAAGQFTGGPLSDRKGRRPVLLMGLFTYTTASIGCSLAGSIVVLLTWRFLQGIGAGACAVLAFAMIRDLFDGDEARAKRSYVTVVFGVAPMLAPLLGAWILNVIGWRSVYLSLAVGGVILLLAVTLGVAESRVETEAPPTSALWGSYRTVLSSRRFSGLVLVNALSFAGVFAYIAGSPIVLMGNFGLTPARYGQVFACTAALLTTGAWVSGRCAQRGVSSHMLLWVGLLLGAGASVVLGVLMAGGATRISVLLGPMLVVLFARGLTSPNLQHVALEPMRSHAGTAAATLGVLQIMSGGLSSILIAVLIPVFGGATMGVAMGVLASAAVAAWAMLCVMPEPMPMPMPEPMPGPGPEAVARPG